MKTIINTEKAPDPIGPYNQAVKTNGFIFVSGQLPIDISTGNLITGNIEKETELALLNIKNILEAAGSAIDKVVKVTVYLCDMSEFPKMNEVYGKVFTENQPARAIIEAARLPKDAGIEIECIAVE